MKVYSPLLSLLVYIFSSQLSQKAQTPVVLWRAELSPVPVSQCDRRPSATSLCTEPIHEPYLPDLRGGPCTLPCKCPSALLRPLLHLYTWFSNEHIRAYLIANICIHSTTKTSTDTSAWIWSREAKVNQRAILIGLLVINKYKHLLFISLF